MTFPNKAFPLVCMLTSFLTIGVFAQSSKISPVPTPQKKSIKIRPGIFLSDSAQTNDVIIADSVNGVLIIPRNKQAKPLLKQSQEAELKKQPSELKGTYQRVYTNSQNR